MTLEERRSLYKEYVTPMKGQVTQFSQDDLPDHLRTGRKDGWQIFEYGVTIGDLYKTDRTIVSKRKGGHGDRILVYGFVDDVSIRT